MTGQLLSEDPQCPGCRVVQEAEARQFRWLLRENYADPATLERMTAAEICPRHLNTLRSGSSPQLTVTLEWLLRWELTQAQTGALAPPGGAPRRRRRLKFETGPDWFQADLGCPFCASGRLAEENWVDAVSTSLHAEDPEARVEKLCRVHFRRVISRISDQTLRSVLVERYARRLRYLIDQCQAYFGDRQEHAEVWRVALTFYWGNRG
ncbi:MAG: hypothetical protein K6U87_06625 [Firmicutes bacterium]|nr:hypothetical protein [Bacillota bacterium]